MASATRVSELHAISTCNACFRVEVSGIRLFPKLKFLAKKQRPNKAWSSWFIPDLKRHSNKAKDLVLCPCRYLKAYTERAKSETEKSYLLPIVKERVTQLPRTLSPGE